MVVNPGFVAVLGDYHLCHLNQLFFPRVFGNLRAGSVPATRKHQRDQKRSYCNYPFCIQIVFIFREYRRLFAGLLPKC